MILADRIMSRLQIFPSNTSIVIQDIYNHFCKNNVRKNDRIIWFYEWRSDHEKRETNWWDDDIYQSCI